MSLALVSAAEAAVDTDLSIFGAGDAVVHRVIAIYLPAKEIAVVLLGLFGVGSHDLKMYDGIRHDTSPFQL